MQSVLSEIKVRAHILSKRKNIQAFLDSGECRDPWQREQLAQEVALITAELTSHRPIVPGLHSDGARLLSA